MRRLTHRRRSPVRIVRKALAHLTAVAPQLRLVEQQIWLAQLPYQNAEHKCIVKETHEGLSADAQAMIGLVLYHPDIVTDGLDQTPAENDYTVRETKNARHYNRGRTVNYIRDERGIPAHAAKRVMAELVAFVSTLTKYTRGGEYRTAATHAMME